MMPQRSKSRLVTVLIHVLIWGAFALAIFLYRPILSASDIPYQFWIRQTVTLCLLVAAFYINAAVLVPRFLEKRRLGYYFVMIIGIVAGVVLIHGWVDSALERSQVLGQVRDLIPRRPPRLDQGRRVDVLIIVIITLVLGISTSITVIRKWQDDRQKREALEKEKVRSELLFLKAQVSPHFFFNTLNNIYALTAVDGTLAGKAIHQLSRMMRYLLYDTQSGHTMLSQEIAFLNDYVSLMQLRFTDTVAVRIKTPTGLLDTPLAPMILLPFVENAFKHGVRPTEPCHVTIVLLQKGKLLELTVKNSIIKDNSVSLDTDSGIGLVNTRRRLELLYPGKYRLDIERENADNEYAVHLVLDLS